MSVQGPEAAEQPKPEGDLEVAALPAAAHAGHGPGAVPVHGRPELLGDLADCLIPGDLVEVGTRPLQGPGEPLGVVPVVRDISPRAAGPGFR